MLRTAGTLALVALTGCAVARREPPLDVAAAVSLTEALQQIATAYRDAGGGEVRFNFAGSNAIARQLLSGSRIDVFISADEAQMDVVDRGGAIAPGSRVDVVYNQLAVVATPERASGLRDVRGLTSPDIRRIAVGDPAAVPAGVYARQYLERLGLWTAVSSRLVPTPSVRAALAAVDRGAADAAIVYVTDAAAAKSARIAFAVPVSEGPRITYPAAIVAGSPHQPAAARFLTFLRGPGAAAIFRRFGFTPTGAQ